MINFDATTQKFYADVNGQRIESPNKGYLQQKLKKFAQQPIAVATVPVISVDAPVCEFDINQRFNYVERVVGMVASDIQPSAIICGEGGLGKSHTVINTLQKAGRIDVSLLDDFDTSDVNAFKVVKGFSTAKGMYRTLYENRNGVVVFDDCDRVLRDPDALNLLKAALDSYSTRVISWNAETRDEELPRSFVFEGGVIFISNWQSSRIDQAIRSRSMVIDLTMTHREKIDRMRFIMGESSFMPDVPSYMKEESLRLIEENPSAKEVSMRTLIKVCKIRQNGGADWADFAKYMMTN